MSDSTVLRPNPRAPSPRRTPRDLSPSWRIRSFRLPLAAALGLLLASVALGCGGDIESRMAEVRALQDVGQFNASIEELREILTVDPNLPEANYRLGVALFQIGEPSRSVWPLQKAADSPEFAITAGLLMASAHFQTRNYDEAVRAAGRVLEVDPDRQAALRLRANANLAGRRLEDALRDTTRLVELYPDDYGVRALHATVLADLGHMEEAEKEHFLLKEMGAASDDPALHVRACLAPAVFMKDVRKDAERARDLYDDCARKDPTDPIVLNHLVSYFESIGERERATQLARSAVESAPENLNLRQTLANRLAVTGDVEAAEKVLEDAVESFGSAAAWNLLANFYRAQKRPAEALEAIEKVRELSGGDGGDQVRFVQADVLIDLGELDRAEQIAGTLSEPTYARLVRGRIQLMRGDPRGALEAFEQGIKAWPNNAGARYLAGLAARDLGDNERAISELREAVRAGTAETDAAIELARLHLALGNYQQAVTFANMALKGPGGIGQSDAYVVAGRALVKMRRYDRARRTIEVLRTRGHVAIATAELAMLEREENGPAQALEVIEASGIDVSDPKHEALLRQLAETLMQLGRSGEAISPIDTAIERAPEQGSLYELRGVALARAERADEARADFEKSLEIEEHNPSALAGLATLKAQGGDLAGAIELFDRAAAMVPQEGSYGYAAAQLTLATGDDAGGEARLRKVVRQAPGSVGARNDLAWILAEKGEELDYALELAQEAKALDASPDILDTLGFVHLQRGEAAEAVAVLEEAVSLRPTSASMRYRLGTALIAAGQKERGREMLQSALALGDFDQAEDARRQLTQVSSN